MKIYVSNLDFSIQNEELAECFATYRIGRQLRVAEALDKPEKSFNKGNFRSESSHSRNRW